MGVSWIGAGGWRGIEREGTGVPMAGAAPAGLRRVMWVDPGVSS